MTFKEFLENKETELFDIGLEILDSKNESVLDFFKGGWNTVAGGMAVTDELLAKAMGDGTKGGVRAGLKQMGRGLRQIAIGDPPKQPASPSSPEQKTIGDPKKPTSPSPEDQTRSFLRDLSKQERGLIPQPEEWKRLIAIYKTAKTSQERKEIRRQLRAVSPQLYQQAIERGKAIELKRRSSGSLQPKTV